MKWLVSVWSNPNCPPVMAFSSRWLWLARWRAVRWAERNRLGFYYFETTRKP
jgi:hypothetical protein